MSRSVVDGEIALLGQVGIGDVSESSAFLLDLRGGRTTGPDQCSMRIANTFSKAAVDVFSAVTSIMFVEPGELGNEVVYASGIGFSHNDIGVPSYARLTQQTGFACNDLNTADTNIGFRGHLTAGTSKWNLFMDGTAPNYLNGPLLLGQQYDNGNGAAQQVGGYTGNYASTKGVGVFGNSEFQNALKTGPFACNGKTPQSAQILGPVATDLSSALDLLNNIRTALINNGIGS